MAHSSILGAETAPMQPIGKDAEALGPSDNSDSGSDAVGTFEAHADSDSVGTGERGAVTPDAEGREGADIAPDHVVMGTVDEESLESADMVESTDLGADDVEARS